MESVLVTGGTGKLGRAVVAQLADRGYRVRMLSRRPGRPGADGRYQRIVGDMRSGRGLAAAVHGVRAIVHCATTNGRGDIAGTRNLVDAASRAGGAPHLVYVSIVGVDDIPIPYYRAKRAAEDVVAGSGLPWSVQRTTQFHDLPAAIFAWQRRLPVTLTATQLRFQPIDTRDVAVRLVDLAVGRPVGRAPDIGGPHVETMTALATIHDEIHGRRRPRVAVPGIPGKIARGFARGHNLVPQNRFGTITFAEFVAGTAREAGS